MSDAEIATIRRWVAEGAVRGNPADLPPVPAWSDEWALAPPDLIVDVPAYTVPAAGGDLYRNLVARVPVEEAHHVTSVEIRPGDPRIVHHARLMIDTTESSRRLDAVDVAPGFDGMDLESDAHNPDGFFLGWTPGKVPSAGPEGLAWRLVPGTDVVLQLHLRPSGRPATVRPRLGFHFGDKAPSRAPALIMLKSFDIDIPAGDSAYVVSDEYVLPVAVDVLSVYPHAHYLGKDLQGFATPPDGRTEWLIRIIDWDFNWQDEYRYATPVSLPAGTAVTMRYTYDNSSANPQNPNDPPRRVVYGSNSSDEMADLILQVLPRTAGDLETLTRDLAWNDEVREVSYLARARYERAEELAARGLFEQAMEQYREGLKLRSNDLDIHMGMARTLVSVGDLVAATLIAERAATLSHRRNPRVLRQLAAVYAADLNPALAIATAEEALDLARSADDEALVRELRDDLEVYSRRQ